MTTVILIFVVASTKSRRHPGAVMAANKQILYNTADFADFAHISLKL